jgi:hypothetical protein
MLKKRKTDRKRYIKHNHEFSLIIMIMAYKSCMYLSHSVKRNVPNFYDVEGD